MPDIWREKKIIIVLQIIIAILAIVYLIKLANNNDLLLIVKAVNFNYYLPSLGLLFFCYLLLSLRWMILLREIQVKLTINNSIASYLAGAFTGIFIPGMIGADATRIFITHKKTEASVIKLTMIVAIEKFLGLVTLFIVLAFGLWLTHYSLAVSTGIFSILTGLIALTLFLAPELSRLLLIKLPPLEKIPCNDKKKWRGITYPSIQKILLPISNTKKMTIITAMFLTIGSFVVDLIAARYICIAFGISVSMGALAVAIPASYLANLLPITPGGIGIREGILVGVLAAFGVMPGEAAGLALAILLNRTIIGLLGGAAILSNHISLGTLLRETDASRKH